MNKRQAVNVAAPGKLILLGEYAVLEGAPALVMAVNRHARASVETVDGPWLFNAPNLKMAYIPFSVTSSGIVRFDKGIPSETLYKLTFFKTTLEYTLRYILKSGHELYPLGITLDTGAFYDRQLQAKLGFGSSAALTVAVTRALLRMFGVGDADRARLFRLALAAHKQAQSGMGSGVDVAASAYGGVLQYRVYLDPQARQEAPVPVKEWTSLPLLCVFTGHSESTRRMVGGVRRLREARPAVFDALMRELGAVSTAGIRAYSQQDKTAFLSAVDAFYERLMRLGKESGMPIISPVHQHLADWARQTGCVYKPSGAGSGDVGVAFAPDMEKLNRLKKLIEQYGLASVPIAIGRITAP